jgi:hypothetical protein
MYRKRSAVKNIENYVIRQHMECIAPAPEVDGNADGLGHSLGDSGGL